ncbi:GNAT family N-acetyltransferase [Leadbettera azotonutricia]|uniref:Acetyltransferase, GNAT family n=1 Tax=Leadbettera azotonutricia (strain ATCC BAA-888 / DSM 13862 / ZAS-9) TaxID=545695 RepID=F5YDY5_LEAAZ|nr:GNAT family N-acetyltransferase [Leadbettera azotonutricia]AEF80846.1 acetyltransferase, GNAT family [Leadbettera azotonutricia ZAS-9]
MTVEYELARLEDYDEVIDLGNYVFSAAHVPHDFPAILPKLYRRENFMDGLHYIAREDGKIKSIIGVYPMELHVLGEVLQGRGIGMVSVHPYSRSKGYMKTLMNLALDDMKRDRVAFSCLGGQRQRYEYFGYTPVGTRVGFCCDKANVNHVKGRDFVSSLSLKPLGPEDAACLENIRHMHEKKPMYFGRPAESRRFYDVLNSWRAGVYAVMEGDEFFGYFIGNQKIGQITEINLKDSFRIIEAVNLFMKDRSDLTVRVQAFDREKMAALSDFAEDCQLDTAYNYRIFNFPAMLKALLKFRLSLGSVPDGKLSFKIGEQEPLNIAVSHGEVSVTPFPGKPDLALSELEAVSFFFSPLTPLASSLVKGNPFLQSLLPLPLFMEHADEV